MEYILIVAFLIGLMFLSNSAPGRVNTRLRKEGGWVAIAMAAVGAYANSRQERSNSREDARLNALKPAQEGLESRRSAQYAADLTDYYRQLDKDRRKKALYNYAGMAAPEPVSGSTTKPIADEYPHNAPLVAKPKPRK